MCHQNRGCTSASAAAGVGILFFRIIDKHSAVLMSGSQIDSFFFQEIQKDFLTDVSEIAGKNSVIIAGSAVEVLKIPENGIAGSRCHTASHIEGIFETIINQFSCSDACDHCTVILEPQGFKLVGNGKGGRGASKYTGSGTCDRPGSR